MKGHDRMFLPEEDFETDPASVVALIVGRTAPDDLTPILHERGWDVRHCPGPGAHRCPLLDDESCELRERSDATVIYKDARGWVDPQETLAIIRCGAHNASTTAAVIAGDYTALDPLEAIPVYKAGVAPTEIADKIEELQRDVENRFG